MHAVGAELERPEGVLERETAVVVAVPVDPDLLAPVPAMTLRVNWMRLRTPSGVAWPTVSDRQRRVAP